MSTNLHYIVFPSYSLLTVDNGGYNSAIMWKKFSILSALG